MAAFYVIAALAALAAAPRAAPSAEEQRLFADGLRAYEAGDARAAERAWKAGYAVAHDPAFLVRIGEAEEKAGAPDAAVESYRRYLREAPDAADRADIEQRLARLAPAAAPAAAANAPPEPTGDFGGAAPPAPPAAAPAAGATAPPPPKPAGPPAAAAAPAAPAADADAETDRTRAGDEENGWNAYRITAWVATAATVALLGTAGFFAASAASKNDDANRLITYRDQVTGAPLEYSTVAQRYQTAFDDGQRDDRFAKAALIGAAAGAAVAVTFFILDARREPAGGVALLPAGGSVGALGSWTWRF
jgi:hypothetical protein